LNSNKKSPETSTPSGANVEVTSDLLDQRTSAATLIYIIRKEISIRKKVGEIKLLFIERSSLNNRLNES